MALFGPDAPGRRCPLIGEEQKFAARRQSDAIDPSETSRLIASEAGWAPFLPRCLVAKCA